MSILNKTLTEYYEKSKEKRKDLESLSLLLKEWKCQEEFFALGMEKIFNKLVKNQDSVEPLRNFHNLFSLLTEKSKQFVHYINKEIIEPIDQFLEKTTNEVKHAYINGLKAGEILQKKYEKANEITNEYFESLSSFEKISKKLNIPQKSGSQKKLFKLLAQTHKQVTETFNSYKYSQAKYSAESRKYQEKIMKTLNTFGECEHKAVSHYQSSMEKIQKSISLKIIASEEVSLEIFKFKSEVFEYSDENFYLPDTSIEQYMNFSREPMPGNYSIFGGSIIENFEQIVERTSKDRFQDIVDKAWNGHKIDDEDFSIFSMQIKEMTGRKAFCFSLNGKRNIGEFCMQSEGFILIAQLILEVLNQCESSQDLQVIKNLILLSQTFYYVTENGEKIFLQQGINGHSLWKDRIFWENFIDDGIFQEIRKQKLKNFEENCEVAESNYKSLIFCQLISYGTIMSEFSVTKAESSELIRKLANKYNFNKGEIEGIFQTLSIT